MLLQALLEIVFSGAILAGAIHEHWFKPGLEREFLALAFFLVPLHLKRILAVTQREATPSLLMTLLEACALTAVGTFPVPNWAVALALITALAIAIHSQGEDQVAARPLSILGTMLYALVCVQLVAAIARGADLSILRTVLFAPVLVEGFAPGKLRSNTDTLRRAAACCIHSGSVFGTNLDIVYPLLCVGAVSTLQLSVLRAPIGARATTRRSRAQKLAFTAIVIALPLVLGELVFRIVPNRWSMLVPFSSIDSARSPGGTTVYEGAFLQPKAGAPIVVRWNQEGWHDIDHALQKPPGTLRVLVLGDSYVEARQVPLEETIHRRIEGLLRERSRHPVEVIAIAASGWGQGQELEALRSNGLAYTPDLIVLEFLPGNDIRNNDDDLEQLARDESVRSSIARVLFIHAVNAHLPFHAFVFERLDQAIRNLRGRREPLDNDVYRESPHTRPELWQRAWTKTEALLREFKSTGVPLVIAVFTSPPEIEACVPEGTANFEDLDFTRPARRMKEICSRNGIPCVDLAPRFAQLPREERSLLHLANDGHWSSTGHQQAAAQIVSFLTNASPIWSAIDCKAR
jgi:hypothetical protein